LKNSNIDSSQPTVTVVIAATVHKVIVGLVVLILEMEGSMNTSADLEAIRMRGNPDMIPPFLQ
jgi:hypothetical protein